jgi:hypothetical protein
MVRLNFLVNTSVSTYDITYTMFNSPQEAARRKLRLPVEDAIVKHHKCSYGDIIVEIANLDLDFFKNHLSAFITKYDINQMVQVIDEKDKKFKDIFTIEDYSLIFKAIKRERFNHSNLLLLIISWYLTHRYLQIDFNSKKLSTLLKEYLTDVYAYFQSLKQMCLGCIDKQLNIEDLAHLSQSIYTKVGIDKKKLLTKTYHVEGLTSLIALDAVHLLTSDIIINKCENCNKYFIPTSRVDEIYCDNIFQNKKTCKQLGYEIKLRNDPFKSAYRTAYKTQRAKVKLHAGNLDYEEKHYKPWEIAAKKAFETFQKKADVEGYKKWLKENRNTF